MFYCSESGYKVLLYCSSKYIIMWLLGTSTSNVAQRYLLPFYIFDPIVIEQVSFV